jgi:alkanesulfonate monooxygenase SsuD/methylene tetrahydromethanopterin reductase-like flavin-dependent oxidoreductase (luciferase family)
MRREIVRYMRVPAYAALFRRAGFATSVDEVSSAVGREDAEGAVRAVDPALASSVAAIGGPDAVRAQLAAYDREGVDRVIVVPFSPTPDTQVTDCSATLRAVIS